LFFQLTDALCKGNLVAKQGQISNLPLKSTQVRRRKGVRVDEEIVLALASWSAGLVLLSFWIALKSCAVDKQPG
jgi:hypothetical protein